MRESSGPLHSWGLPSNHLPGRGGRRGADLLVHCAEQGKEVSVRSECWNCKKLGVWVEGDTHRCLYEYRRLKSEGFYAKTHEEWMEALRNTDPELYAELAAKERHNEEVRANMEADWAAMEERRKEIREELDELKARENKCEEKDEPGNNEGKEAGKNEEKEEEVEKDEAKEESGDGDIEDEEEDIEDKDDDEDEEGNHKW
jgi:hypothetical protein